MSAAVWSLVSFGCGSLPFSVWLVRACARVDVRQTGDGIPGAANAWKGAGWRVGVAVLLLDYLKGAVPVGLAHFVFHLSGFALAVAALAPILGHAWSPFLRWQGGKGLSVTFGVWTGLSLAQAPLVLGLFMAFFYFAVDGAGWAVLFSLPGLLAHLLMQGSDAGRLGVWAGNAGVLVWKYRRDLSQLSRLKPLFAARRAPR